jgi:hypothetical protein
VTGPKAVVFFLLGVATLGILGYTLLDMAVDLTNGSMTPTQRALVMLFAGGTVAWGVLADRIQKVRAELRETNQKLERILDEIHARD